MRSLTFISAVLLAGCGGRTPIDTDPEDAAPTDDAAERDVSMVDDRIDAAGIRDAEPFDGPWATCTTCSAGLNVKEQPVVNCGQAAEWLALEMPIPCDRFAKTVAVHSTTGALRIFVDDGTRHPGNEIVAATKTVPVAGKPGWVGIAPNLKLVAGTYWIAMWSSGLGGGGTSCAFAKSGVSNAYYGSFGNDDWNGPYFNPLMIEIGDCD